METRLADGAFDTLVMGELLDPLDDPGAVLDRGLDYLTPGGRVVLTAPFGVYPREDYRAAFSLTDMIDLLRPRVALDLLRVEDNHIRFAGRLSEERETSWRNLDAGAVLSMTGEALTTSQASLYEMLDRSDQRIERLQRRLRQRAESDQAETRRLQRKVNSASSMVKRSGFRAKLDRIALKNLDKEVENRTREVEEVREELRATRSTTTFLVGSALVRSATKRPSHAVEAAHPAAADIPLEVDAASEGGRPAREDYTAPLRSRRAIPGPLAVHRHPSPVHTRASDRRAAGGRHPRHVHRVRLPV